MLSGRETLDHLNATLKTARRELDRLDHDLQRSSENLSQNQQAQVQTLRRLAGLRLDALSSGRVEEFLESADFRARELLNIRADAIETLRDEIAGSGERLTSLEDERDNAHERVERAAQVLSSTEASVQSKLEAETTYQAQLQTSRAAEAIAVSAEEKVSLALEDRKRKGAPYENDRLFSYLWSRHYGTSEYRANLVARLLDSWVARLCNYQSARPNYFMLLEIPRRLGEHADRLREKAESELEKLRQLEEEAAQGGGVPAAQRDLEQAEQRQDEIDDKLTATENQLQDLRARQGRFAAGQDKYVQQALEVLAEAMRRREVSELTRMARGTLSAEDDALVGDLRDLHARETALRSDLEGHRQLHRSQLERLQELEGVRRQFKARRFDDLRSGFDNEQLILAMLRQFLGGGVRGGALWDLLTRHQRYRDVGGAWPDFGSGSLGRRRRMGAERQAPWHWPGGKGRRGGSRFRLPRRGGPASRGGGRFRTGGGF